MGALSYGVGLVMLTVGLAVPGYSAATDEAASETSFDGLVVTTANANTVVYKKPDAELGEYTKLLILPCQVAFQKGWAQDFNRAQGNSVSAEKITERDMAKIRQSMAELFAQVFSKELGDEGGYAIVSEPAADTLLLRPAIVDLHVSAPVLDPAVRTRVRSAGGATLFLELYDSVSGEILARIVDRRADPERHHWQWATRAFNEMAAERIMKQWATQLRQGLDAARGDDAQEKKADAGEGQ